MKLRQAKKIINFIINNKQNSKWFKYYDNYLNISCIKTSDIYKRLYINPTLNKAIDIVYKFDYCLYKKYDFIKRIDKLNIECDIVSTIAPKTVNTDTDNI